MGSDWNQPRDKAPPIEEPNRHRKRGGRKKPFVIEAKYVGELKGFWGKLFKDSVDWHVHARYATEKSRQQAFDNLMMQQERGRYQHHYARWEYRIPDDSR